MPRDFKIERGSSRNSSERFSSRAVYDEAAIEEEEEQEGRHSRNSSSREIRRRQRTKARAEKLYDKQFNGKDGISTSEGEGAPRAALYKGKMGASQRKASKMQRSMSLPAINLPSMPSLPDPAEAKEQATNMLNHSSVTPRSLRIVTVVACLVFACVFLYTPAQQYYHAEREHARLTAEYESIQGRNDALNVQNDILTSDAGMEDAVRQKYGYVKNGEEMGIVMGLSEDATDTSRDSENIEANVLSSSVKAPEEWYTPFLDALFGVE